MINPGSIFPAARTLGTTNLGSTIVQSRSKENAPLMSSSTPSLDSLDIGDDLRSTPRIFSKSRLMSTSAGRRARNMFKNNVGLLYVVASQVFFSVMSVSVKSLNNLDPPVPAIELIVVRMAITYICCLLYMLVTKVPNIHLGPTGVRLLLVFRGFTGFFGLFGSYYSIQFLSLSDATVLTFLSPFTTAIASSLILKEPFSVKDAFAGLFSLVGVVLIARPSALFSTPTADGVIDGVTQATQPSVDNVSPSQRLIAVGVALIGVLGSTGAYTSMRAIGKRAHPLHNVTSLSVQCVLVASAGMIIMRTPVVLPTRLEWLFLFLLIGVSGFIAQLLLTLGLQRETAGRGTLAIYVQIVFVAILERIFFNTVPSFLSVTGTIIIMSSAIYVALTKEMNPKKTVPLDHSGDAALEEGLLEHAEHQDEDEDQETYKLTDMKDSGSTGDDQTSIDRET